jgi:DNA helicase-2/ATP-dependent DNA helicase PcrA
MDELKEKRQQLMDKISKYNARIFNLQNELLNIEQLIVESDHKEIMETLTLNEQQLKVINSKDKYTLVIACPGSGKTHTLISMYIKLIVQDKINPDNVLLITFTKKAGQEMSGRLSSLVPTKLPAYVGSLHGLSYRVLQEYKNINYTVLDEKESKDMIKDLCDQFLDMDDNESVLVKQKIVSMIDQASSSYPFNLLETLKQHSLEKLQDKMELVYNKYQQKKTSENLVDFNDLMISFSHFLDTDESLEFKNKIKFIFFDEYQDVNPIQHYILSKFKGFARIMVVGDDAQAIYAFRGSSVDYILNFPNEFKPNKMYLLEKNYRSTKQIVNYFQDIISKNTNQYKKDVISVSPNEGIKPVIIGFDDNKQRDQWIINDIFKNKKNGISLSKMVILARKNESLDKIEIELVKQGITVIKHTGLSILDKHHVKDFLAFIIVLINDKSSIHWKRILSLHLNVNLAHEIIEGSNNKGISIRESIKKLKDTQVTYANSLKELDSLFDFLSNKKSVGLMKDADKARHILSYLERIWANKNKYDSHLDEKVKDILLLISYLSSSSMKEFISELYLNQSIEVNLDNTIYLTTIHGSKGLEWDYVYLIDVDSDNFPSVKHGYYLDEGEEMEEERRLFYVACSRAKYNLVITYNFNPNPSSLLTMSPFIREINKDFYTGINVDYNSYGMSGVISMDVTNYLKYYGFSKLYPIIKNIKCERKVLHSGFEIPRYLDKFKYSRLVIGNFIDFLIAKMIQINFTKQIKKFELNIVHKLEKFPQKIRQNYIDELNDWRNLLEDIFFIATFNIKDEASIFDDLKKLLINDKIYNHYNEISEKLSNSISENKPKEINSHYNVTHAKIKGEIDILVEDKIFEIKTNQGEISTMANITQTLLYGYLLNKKGKTINQIILYNPLSGEINLFDTKDFNFKEIATIVYEHFKQKA